ncbi:hypothetical protein BpHYR1_037965 [Brachionus plicatilis]|uniref:Voltage-dependent calcium channel gamma-5 subunit n=1 Tax=Brachionus plicatilis TaxID=10195 RepID=A0A3M7QMC4_BRAPC|nr:hypothetical protein BpHYR1_037965 [Brachionus plicatilis]
MDTLLLAYHMAKKISTALAILCSILALLLCWIGFSVPDWLFYEDEYMLKKKFGLWTFCYQNRESPYIYNCKSWRNAPDQIPDFLRTTQVLITMACILSTFSVIVGVLSLFFRKGYAKILPLVAGLLCLLTLILVLIALSVFGSDHALYAQNLAGKKYNRRYGYWIYVLVIIFLLVSTFAYPFSFISNSSKNNESIFQQKPVQNNFQGPYPSLGVGGNQPVNRSMDFVDTNSIQMNQNNFSNKFNVPPLINNFKNNNQYTSGEATNSGFGGSVFPNTQKYSQNFYY